MTVDAVRSDLAAITRHVSARTRDGTYRFTPYRQRLILKGAGRPPRVISIPTVRDRIALRAVADVLVDVFPGSGGHLPQTSVAHVMDALATGRYDSFVRIDVKDFFPSVNHDLLMRALRKRVRKPEILRVIRRAIATPTAADGSARPRSLISASVPQGLSISNPLAEIYVSSVDQTMGRLVGASYHRFVDDILILCARDDAERIDEKCRDELAQLDLLAHPQESGGKSEIGAVADGFHYLGYTFKPGSVGVRHASIVRLESHLAGIHAAWQRESLGDPAGAHHRLAWHRNLAVTGCVFQGVAFGWLQYFRQLDDLSLLKRLDATVARLGRRYRVPSTPTPKSFMAAYWAIKHPRARNTPYIPNFDLYDVQQMRNELSQIGVSTTTMDDRQTKDEFYRVISRAVKDLERDIGDLS